MSLADNTLSSQETGQLYALFSQLDAQQVETFYKRYQQWLLEQQSTVLQEQLVTLEQQIVDNQVLMQLTQPSPIALATLTRLQSLGVDDVDLLDSMLERGDTWLDHALQLLEQCERLDVIHGNYTEWCQHALEDAYNWLDSIHEQEQSVQTAQTPTNDDVTEVLLLQKLMSEDAPVGTDVSRPSSSIEMSERRDTSVPTDKTQHIPIPSILSYATTIEHTPTSIQYQKDITEPPVQETQLQEARKKSPKYGLVSRVLAKAWKT